MIPWYAFVKNAGWLDGFKHNIEGELVTAMEEKTKKCVEAGAKNKISYEIKAGHAANQVVKACEETR